jgi:hypothetical protein
MPEFQYLDLDLDIERTPSGYRVEVTNSPAGHATADFTLPFSDLEIENSLLKLGGARRRVRRLESAQMETAKQFGGKLFKSLFAGDVLSVYASSLAEANARNVGLRLRLHLDAAPELGNLPWEFLYNSALNQFLALSVKTPIVRFIELPKPIRPLTVEPPLRILVMISAPADYETLDVEREWKQLKTALAGVERQGRVILERLEEASLGALQRKLQEHAYHIFHFIGHGGFDSRAQDGELVLEDEHARGRRVSAQQLSIVLHDHASLRLALVNACEGGRTSQDDPFAGVAASLVQQGIPAVIAMQFEISDDVATVFAGEFYRVLAQGHPVDWALGEARKLISGTTVQPEWGTPVLFLRAQNGNIFDIQPAPETQPTVETLALPSRLLNPERVRTFLRSPWLWGILLGTLALLAGLFFLANPFLGEQVKIGNLATSSTVIPGPLPDTFVPVGRKQEFPLDDPSILVVVEMVNVLKSDHLTLRVWQVGGFEEIYQDSPLSRDVRGEANAWRYFPLSPNELCSQPQAQCPGTFHAEIFVNGRNQNKETIFTILPAVAIAITATPTTTPTPDATATSTLTPTSTATALTTPTLLPNAPPLIVHFVIPQDALTPTEYEVDPSTLPVGPATAQEFLRVTRVAYGDLDDGRRGYDVRVVVKNITDAQIRLQVDRKFFSLEDRLGRRANLVYFCCATPEIFLDSGKEREIQLVFESRPEWGGKGGENLSYFLVRGFLPIVRASWDIPLPVTAE